MLRIANALLIIGTQVLSFHVEFGRMAYGWTRALVLLLLITFFVIAVWYVVLRPFLIFIICKRELVLLYPIEALNCFRYSFIQKYFSLLISHIQI